MSGQDAADTPRKSLASRALGSGAWSMANFGLGQIMRLGSNLILTRILSPEDFGLMALVTSFLIGLGGTVVRNLPQVEQRLGLEDFIDQPAARQARALEAIPDLPPWVSTLMHWQWL